MSSPKDSLPDFLRAATGEGLQPDLFVYVTNLVTEFRAKDGDAPIFKLRVAEDKKISIHAPDGEIFGFGGSRPDAAGRWQDLQLTWHDQEELILDAQIRMHENLVIDHFYEWCADHCPPGMQVALEMVEVQSRHAVDQSRRLKDAGQSGPSPEGDSPWI